MGIIRSSGGGGGADTSVVTAEAGDVLMGKVIVGPDGEPLSGTMPNRGAVSYSLPINGSYTIGDGYHNGSGKVTQSIPTQGDLTLNPGTTAKTGSVSGKYMTGNITVPAINIPANVIKKNYRVNYPDGSGVTGTFEGFVPGAYEIYNRGSWGTGYSTSSVSPIAHGGGINPKPITFEGTCFRVPCSTYSATLQINPYINMIPYNTINFILADTDSHAQSVAIWVYNKAGNRVAASSNIAMPDGNVEKTVSLDISSVMEECNIRVHGNQSIQSSGGISGYIFTVYKIWFT